MSCRQDDFSWFVAAPPQPTCAASGSKREAHSTSLRAAAEQLAVPLFLCDQPCARSGALMKYSAEMECKTFVCMYTCDQDQHQSRANLPRYNLLCAGHQAKCGGSTAASRVGRILLPRCCSRSTPTAAAAAYLKARSLARGVAIRRRRRR